MKLRSLLFVPGDRPDRMRKALYSGADAVILDLEDSVTAGQKAIAREHVVALLGEVRGDVPLFVRINPLGSSFIRDDIAAIAPSQADGIVLPKAEGAASIAALMAMPEMRRIKILPIATETPKAIFELGSFGLVADQLMGITWGAEDLPTAIGAETAREPDGHYTAPYEMVRALALFAAHAAGVPAFETVYPDFKDSDGLAAYAARGRRDGFTGMMAIHPAQVAIINQAFTPQQAEIARALAIVEAFKAHPDAGVLQLDGQMIDRPHLKAALAPLRSVQHPVPGYSSAQQNRAADLESWDVL